MSWQDIASQVTLCNFGTTGAAFAAAAAWKSAYTGQIWGVVGFGATSAALAAASAANGCYTPPPEEPSSSLPICCKQWSIEAADPCWKSDDGNIEGIYRGGANVMYLRSARPGGKLPDYSPEGWVAVTLTVAKADGVSYEQTGAVPPHYLTSGCFTLGITNFGECVDESPGTDPEPILPDPPDPVPVPDPDTGCTWNVTMADAYLNQRGNLVVLYKATSNDPDTCGPDQYWWHETGKDPTPITPDPRPDPDPPIPPPEPLPCCDDIKTKLDELKDCACKPDKPELWLHWRSLRFESDDYSPNGKSRLIKLFRYRGSSPGDVRRVADHWKDFRWTTGSTVVIHKGSPVGTPQVWAKDADEGKRVIRHAFLEAGADADSVGEWVITGPSGSRKGVSTEVGLLCVDGCWSATARRGSNGWPQAAVASPDP